MENGESMENLCHLCGTHICVVSRSAKKIPKRPKGDWRLRRKVEGDCWLLYLYPYGFGMGPRGPLGGGERSSKSPPVIGGRERCEPALENQAKSGNYIVKPSVYEGSFVR